MLNRDGSKGAGLQSAPDFKNDAEGYEPMKWEYRVDKMPIRSGGFVGNGMNVDAVDEAFMNERGALGWELVSAMPLFVPQNPTDCFVYYYWKRRVGEAGT